MTNTRRFSEMARLPAPDDNAAIACIDIAAGTRISHSEGEFVNDYTVLEGHRFAVKPIRRGEELLSWGLPFGVAIEDIEAGQYVRNIDVIEELSLRNLSFDIPSRPNFENRIQSFELDEGGFKPGTQVAQSERMRTFMGFRRGENRGVGTRNTIVVLGTTSRTASFARRLADQMNHLASRYENIDGIVAVAHTEGGEKTHPNNADYLLRTLAGYMVHPNVGAILAADYGSEPVNNKMLRAYLLKNEYPIDEVLHRFISLRGGFEENIAEGIETIQGWLPSVNNYRREPAPLSNLKLALQCGGSDAFSGISGNPLAGCVAREIIRYGGSANLAETDELIGAESYVLENVRDFETAKAFLDKIAAFQERASWHDVSAEGNPGGGNRFRGIYNIVLKSLGAATKRNPEVRLDYVIDYSELMERSGFYFMDSPGNDLESVAGQVASGCNLVSFVTGNGSITNFPFVPTIKIVTTTERYDLLPNEMDVNAGAYFDGTPMDELGDSTFELALSVASGTRSKGESAGHSQVMVWRNWRQTSADTLAITVKRKPPSGEPLSIKTERPPVEPTFNAILNGGVESTERVGLILPTSLCAGQVAMIAAERLNKIKLGRDHGVSRFAALAHTEGCAVSGESAKAFYKRTMLGYLTHPNVAFGLLMEHGCELTHNDYFRNELALNGIEVDRFGWVSIQRDGGFENALDRVEDWFRARLEEADPVSYARSGVSNLAIGILSSEEVPSVAGESLGVLTRRLTGLGATVIVPESATLLENSEYCGAIGLNLSEGANLAYGQKPESAGFYVQESPGGHWVETLTGLGGSGVEIFLAFAGDNIMQGHPMIPMIQIAGRANEHEERAGEVDCFLGERVDLNVKRIEEILLDVASREYIPRTSLNGNVDFQFNRGLTGFSL